MPPSGITAVAAGWATPDRRFFVYIMRLLLTVIILLSAAAGRAEEVYLAPQKFIDGSFENPPPAETLWLTGEPAEAARRILGHEYHKLRVRYWREKQRTAWVLEEIGKERYITAGFVIDGDRMERTEILIFRESRGWEIRHSFFTDQFRGATLDGDNHLDRGIDNITGATLSVRAIERLARLALFLHGHVTGAAGDNRE